MVVGNSKCFGHVQCDSIIMGKATIESIPAITANSTDAQLIHEAAIGKIAGDQLLKLQTLGLTEEEAEDTILKASSPEKFDRNRRKSATPEIGHRAFSVAVLVQSVKSG